MSGPIILGHWNFWIVLYLWLVGIGTGAFLTAYYIDRKAGARDMLVKASWIGVVTLVVGMLFLLVDLGRPLRFWHILVSFMPLSPMWIGTWIIAITTVSIFLAALTKSKGVALLAAITAALAASYVGVLLTVSAIPLWSGTLMLPWLFLASAFTTGAATLSLLSKGNKYNSILGEVGKTYGFLELIILALFVIWGFVSAPTATANMVIGKYIGAFWIGVLILGIIAPLYLNFKTVNKIKPIPAILMIMVGGFVLRYIIVFAVQ